MPEFIKNLDNRLRSITESTNVKDPYSAGYDRQTAEDALFHTIGPLTNSPRWSNEWTSPGAPPDGFAPGGAAPQWTKEEVIYAFAGDPNLLFAGRKDDPKSPEYGTMGGAPLLRVAKKYSRQYARSNDRQFITDMYQNGFVTLLRLTQPGYDKSEKPFISYAIGAIKGTILNGVGGTAQSDRAYGAGFKTNVHGLLRVLQLTDPDEVMAVANQVGGKYRTQSLNDKHPDNPFGLYSPVCYKIMIKYANALKTGDDQSINLIRDQIQQLRKRIKDENVHIPGASTGMGQAISTPDRKTNINIASIDASSSGDDSKRMAPNIPDDTEEEPFVDKETISHMLDITINNDLNKLIGGIPKYVKMAVEIGAKGGKIGGKMLANELRYIIRTLGPIASSYPGKGTIRANIDIPRDAKNWWEPGSDPEIEPIPETEGIWQSGWSRTGNYDSMGPTEISQEMTKEVEEFNHLGIQTARLIKIKTEKRSGRKVKETISKVAVSNTLRSAVVKLKFIAVLERENLGMNESTRNHPLLEEISKTDSVDRELLAEACDWACNRIEAAINEKASKGWKKTVEHMKNDEGMTDDEAFSRAWTTYKKGGSQPDKRKKNTHYTKEDIEMRPVNVLVVEN